LLIHIVSSSLSLINSPLSPPLSSSFRHSPVHSVFSVLSLTICPCVCVWFCFVWFFVLVSFWSPSWISFRAISLSRSFCRFVFFSSRFWKICLLLGCFFGWTYQLKSKVSCGEFRELVPGKEVVTSCFFFFVGGGGLWLSF
jgi:hypothetical protein